MKIQISEEPIAALAEQARLSAAFRVDRIFELSQQADRFVLSERNLDVPYLKDYDAIENPIHWATRFDVSSWGYIAARSMGRRVGGAVIAWNSPGLDMLEDRADLAVLWDIRVAPEHRGRNIGSSLFAAAEAWAVSKNCRQLKVETQNINVNACRFYAKHGCVLKTVRRLAYPMLPDEIQMLWYKDLSAAE
ncbi:MAG TPA: GNAT family N-acetyltransferase [Tepidisphaeraceae bacterium]|jgi:GNAT superfamily N-acetyltransferase